MIIVRYFFAPCTNTFIEYLVTVQLLNAHVKEKGIIFVLVNHFSCCREVNEPHGEHKCSKVRSVDVKGAHAHPSLTPSQTHKSCWSKNMKEMFCEKKHDYEEETILPLDQISKR